MTVRLTTTATAAAPAAPRMYRIVSDRKSALPPPLEVSMAAAASQRAVRCQWQLVVLPPAQASVHAGASAQKWSLHRAVRLAAVSVTLHAPAFAVGTKHSRLSARHWRLQKAARPPPPPVRHDSSATHAATSADVRMAHRSAAEARHTSAALPHCVASSLTCGHATHDDSTVRSSAVMPAVPRDARCTPTALVERLTTHHPAAQRCADAGRVADATAQHVAFHWSFSSERHASIEAATLHTAASVTAASTVVTETVPLLLPLGII
jgi:hypothetical protein